MRSADRTGFLIILFHDLTPALLLRTGKGHQARTCTRLSRSNQVNPSTRPRSTAASCLLGPNPFRGGFHHLNTKIDNRGDMGKIKVTRQ